MVKIIINIRAHIAEMAKLIEVARKNDKTPLSASIIKNGDDSFLNRTEKVLNSISIIDNIKNVIIKEKLSLLDSLKCDWF